MAVVKCSKCNLFFSPTEKDTKCPFCKTEHDGKVVALKEGEPRPESGREEKPVEEKPKDLPAGRQGKKGAAKTQKKPFKMWGDS